MSWVPKNNAAQTLAWGWNGLKNLLKRRLLGPRGRDFESVYFELRGSETLYLSKFQSNNEASAEWQWAAREDRGRSVRAPLTHLKPCMWDWGDGSVGTSLSCSSMRTIPQHLYKKSRFGGQGGRWAGTKMSRGWLELGGHMPSRKVTNPRFNERSHPKGIR